jgi:predicted ATPase/DNA-binding SARP family transcriptional activator
VYIRLLGPLEVVGADGRAVDVSGVRLRALLVRLAIDAPRPVPTSTLVDALWGDDPPADANNALQSLVSRLRRALAAPDVVQQAPGGYQLEISRDDVDLHRFTDLAREGRARLRSGDPTNASDTLREALALWRGDLPETWGDGIDAASYQTRLTDQRLDAVGDRFDAELELGRADDIVNELGELVVRYPLRERLAGLFCRALAAIGRQSEALGHFEQLRHRLADELGVDPSPELQAIHLAIVRGEIEQPLRRTTAPRRSNLKAGFTSFVGRDDDVARIAKLLDESRLVTLVGPGGAGKTRLATVAASTLVDSIPDGVWLAELAPVTDADDVASAVLDALDLRDATLLDRPTATAAASAIRDPTERLVAALTARECLLLLDNCEHVIDAAARLADDLLAQCPELRIVTTSREPLGIVGETLVVVPPLAQPRADADAAEALSHPAVRLFADRAAAVDPDLAIDDSNIEAVVEIVRRLDGLPLAIELAAARLRSLPVDEIAARLSDRFKLLTGGSRTAMSRHRTLRAVVEWSWDLLTERERSLVERLAVFAGTFAPRDAQAVCADAALP